MEKLSVYIVTLNEEERLPRTLEAAQKVADEIIVVDSGSTDRTCEIAESYGAKVMFHQWKNISAQKKYAQEQCSNDLVLSLDADEVLSDKLIAEILSIKENRSVDAYKIKIADMMPGDKTPSRFAKTYNLVRLYDKTKSFMPDDLTHDRVVLGQNVCVAQLKSLVYHYSYLTLTKTWDKYNAYTDELVKTAVATNKKYSLFRLVIEFPYQFFRYYFLKRMFLQGRFGFINATTLAYFRFLKIAKWQEYYLMNKDKK
ncbi:MAG: glycosyltransferase family 2 protein [Alphaproteobacteria bacterium]|nr:glycosyltransferase family 2 protein [Alphaproteobacteria bacterium]